MKHMTWLLIPSLAVGVYTAFVAMCMWNWFAVKPLGLPTISFLEMVGLVWLTKILISQPDVDESKWKLVYEVLDICVPDEKREMLNETLQRQTSNMWFDALIMVFGQILENTTTLALGYGLHVLIR